MKQEQGQQSTKYHNVCRSLSEMYMSVLFDELTALAMVRQNEKSKAKVFRDRGAKMSDLLTRFEDKDLRRGHLMDKVDDLEQTNAALEINNDAWNRKGGLEHCLRQRIIQDLPLFDIWEAEDLAEIKYSEGAQVPSDLRRQYAEIFWGRGEFDLEKLEQFLHTEDSRERAVFKDLLTNMGKDSHKRFEARNPRLRDDEEQGVLV